jgi:hypothetical protein
VRSHERKRPPVKIAEHVTCVHYVSFLSVARCVGRCLFAVRLDAVSHGRWYAPMNSSLLEFFESGTAASVNCCYSTAIAVYTFMELTVAYFALLKVLFVPLLEGWPLLRHNYVKLRHATDIMLTELEASFLQIS